MLKIKKFSLLAVILLLSSLKLYSYTPEKLGIIEKLDTQIPLETEITNSDGKVYKLSELIDKPTVFAFVYYTCPGICSPLLTGLADLVERTDLIPGEDYQVITLSFDHRENAKLAADWKANYLGTMKRKMDENDWRFTVSDSITIKKLADTMGFYFKPEANKIRKDTVDYLHSAGLIVVSPTGKITRYHLGTKFLPFNLKMSIIEAQRGESRPTVSAVMDFCFKYDPDGRKYVFNILRVVGTVLLMFIGIFIIYLVRSVKKDNLKKKREAEL